MTAGMGGVAPRDAGVAGGLVHVAHHLGGAVGLSILITVFAAAGSPGHGAREVLADRVSASLSAATVFLALAVVVTAVSRARERAGHGEATVSAADRGDLEHRPREALVEACSAA